MSYRYNPYRDTFEHIPDEQPIVVQKLKNVTVTNVGNIPVEVDE